MKCRVSHPYSSADKVFLNLHAPCMLWQLICRTNCVCSICFLHTLSILQHVSAHHKCHHQGVSVAIIKMFSIFFLFGATAPQWVRTSSFTRFINHTQRRTTVCRTPLDEWSARRRDLYLTTHNIHNREIFMPLLGFEPTIPAGERPQTYALYRAVTGTGYSNGSLQNINHT